MIPPQTYSVLLFLFCSGFGAWLLYRALLGWWQDTQLARSLDGVEAAVIEYYHATATGDEDAAVTALASLSEYMGRR